MIIMSRGKNRKTVRLSVWHVIAVTSRHAGQVRKFAAVSGPTRAKLHAKMHENDVIYCVFSVSLWVVYPTLGQSPEIDRGLPANRL